MSAVTHANRLYQKQPEQRYLEPDSKFNLHTAKTIDKPARITKRQLSKVLSLVQRMAAGGDATCFMDAQACVPLLQAACAVAPRGQPPTRKEYAVTLADGQVFQPVRGLGAVCRLTGKAQSTIANALSIGGGTAEFPGVDENGNPAKMRVDRLVPTKG